MRMSVNKVADRAEWAPLEKYRRLLAERESALYRMQRREDHIANARLVLFLIGVAMAWLAFGAHKIHPLWLIAPLLGFCVLVILHEKVLRAISRIKSGKDFYARGIARIEERWMGVGPDGAEFALKEHAYAGDLDLFGVGSLFQLICAAQTRGGAETLAKWLCAPADPDEIRARQAAVNELRPRLELREELEFLGRGMRTSVSLASIYAWTNGEPAFAKQRTLIIANAATISAVISSLIMICGGPSAPLLISVIALAALHGYANHRVSRVFLESEEPARELAVVADVLARLEREPFTDPNLLALQTDLREGAAPASKLIAKLRRILNWREASLNMLFWPISFIAVWNLHFACAIERWRLSHGASVKRWIDAVGRLEALCSIASYSYEHPRDPFPTILDHGSVFEGKSLGHPLLPESRCVRNDAVLDSSQRLMILSGSNMSGKSVYLRTVGVNAVLALTGAPVRAESLTISPLAIGSTLNVHDAIQDGVSRFYAEIKRIRLLMDEAKGSIPLLFLLDEIFHGTNSWDRRVGAAAVLRGLMKSGAIGIITTHDLAITELEGEYKGAAVNVHFEDQIQNGQLLFDYVLRSGVVKKSNALDLMKIIGLDVD
jgi:hypothetical protein